MLAEKEPRFYRNGGSNSNQPSMRHLGKKDLGGVIFGCTNNTMGECLRKQLFGLPAPHYVYVQNIDPGLPLFLFNYSGRTLNGIYESVSHGRMNIDPYGWTVGGSDRTPYPAQVQVKVGKEYPALSEAQFRAIISDNYYSNNHFWFELDHAQTGNLVSMLRSLPSSSTFSPQRVPAVFRTTYRDSNTKMTKHSVQPNQNTVQSISGSTDSKNDPQEKQRLCMKLTELSSHGEFPDPSPAGYMDNVSVLGNLCLEDTVLIESHPILDKNSGSTEAEASSIHVNGEVEQMKALNAEQGKRTVELERKVAEAEREIRRLKRRCSFLESMAGRQAESLSSEVVYLVGGYNGTCWLSVMDAYSPSDDTLRPRRSMDVIRAYSAIAKLNGELYVFGGGNGESLWYDTVKSYDPWRDEWVCRPCMSKGRGSLAGATVGERIYAVGGGNELECFSDVEVFHAGIGRWMPSRSMIHKRFAPSMVELQGALYVAGGYDGNHYLSSMERFDPREHCWVKDASMTTTRGCHSMVVLNEKIYNIGGYDGDGMISSVEVFDPRLSTWVISEPMNVARGYSAAAVLNGSIVVMGGLKTGDEIVETVEMHEGNKWRVIDSNVIGRRCFFSALVL